MLIDSKRVANDFKSDIDLILHDFVFETFYLEKYLEDSETLIIKSKNLPKDVSIYSDEAHNYFWQVNHEHYFCCSFMFMLMQISEDICEKYKTSLKRASKNALLSEPQYGSYYKKFETVLQKDLEFDYNSNKWEMLKHLYQLRNSFVHQNGTLSSDTKLVGRRNSVILLSQTYPGISIVGDQVILDIQFSKFAIKIMTNGISDLLKKTKDHINALKKQIL